MITSYSNRLMTASDPYVWMTASEVAFLRAEGALRKWNMGGEAKDFYETGVKLSFEEHGASGAEDYLNSIPTQPHQPSSGAVHIPFPGFHSGKHLQR